MGINSWWDGDPQECYWMEITDRTDLGANLLAPTTAKGGKETFSYTLVDYVKEGDVVFHWWSANRPPAIVASSRVSGNPFRSRISWAARSANSEGVRSKTAFEAPLDDFVELDTPLSLEDLRAVEPKLRELRDELEARVKGPIYFPWAFSGKRPLRTTQGYLVKLPAAVVRELGLLGSDPPATVPGKPRTIRGGSNGRQQDPELRRETEQYAVKIASKYFEQLGYEVEDVGAARSYDLHAVDQDGNEVHIEVKGSTTRSTTIELTSGEVQHWDEAYERALVVVDEIQWERRASDYVLTGGRRRVWRNWVIDEEEGQLVPTRYRYTLIDLVRRS